jgi:hypothetical protein
MTKKSPTGRTLSLPPEQHVRVQKLMADPNEGGRIIPSDYSHAEERIIAHMITTGEPINKIIARKAEEFGLTHREHRVNGARPVSFEEACNRYVHRFTMDHVPAWAQKPVARSSPHEGGGKYPGPHYGSDLEWYKNTEFPDRGGRKRYCRSTRQTYPLGKWLDKPFTLGMVSKEAAGVATPTSTPDPRAIKRAEGKRKKRLAQFEIEAINPVIQAIKDHQPEPRRKRAVPTVAELVQAEPKRKKPAKGKTKKQRKAPKTKK